MITMHIVNLNNNDFQSMGISVHCRLNERKFDKVLTGLAVSKVV